MCDFLFGICKNTLLVPASSVDSIVQKELQEIKVDWLNLENLSTKFRTYAEAYLHDNWYTITGIPMEDKYQIYCEYDIREN